jgi:hypothetical protein
MVVSRALRLTATVAVASVAVLGCKGSAKPAPGSAAVAGGVRGDAAAGAQPARPAPAGMKAPFEPRTSALARTFAAGAQAFRTKKYGAAEQLFHQVVVARPDDTAARYQEFRAAVHANPDADLREPLRALLFRDFVAYDHRLVTGKDFAPLWAGPRASELEAIRASARAAFADRLGEGAFFVARNRAAEPVENDEAGSSALALHEETYAFDPASGLVRRLSETGGDVAGMKVDRAGKLLVMLVVKEVVPTEAETTLSFAAVSGETLSLQTLDATGPIALPMAASVSTIILCTTARGEARWILGRTTYALDANKRKAVAVGRNDCAPATRVSVTPERGSFLRPIEGFADAGVVDLAVDGGSRPIKLAELARSASVGWSPGRSRLAFARPLDPCRLQLSGWPSSGMNSLDVWEPAAARTVRLATAFSFFAWDWIDDDRLVYEGGGPKDSKIVVHDFRAQTDAVLEVPSGAGLSAVPSFDCGPAVEETDDGAE